MEEKRLVNLEIRLATLEDLDTLVLTAEGVLEDLAEKGLKHLYGGNDREEFKEAIEGSNSGCVVAKDKETGQLVGYLVFNNHNEATLREIFPDHKMGSGLCLDGTGVHLFYKQKGVFAQMYEWMDQYAEKNGYSVFFGTVDPTNVPSILAAFYSAIQHGASIEYSGQILQYPMRDDRVLNRLFLRIKRKQK